MIRLTAVEPLDLNRIRVTFTDGLEGVIDLSDLIGKGVFARLSDPEQFSQVYIDPETHTVAWPGGIDLCPDTLYQDIKAKQQAA